MLLHMMCPCQSLSLCPEVALKHGTEAWHRSVALSGAEVERLNLLVSANGSVLRSEILGALKMKLQPELKSVPGTGTTGTLAWCG